ncbi:MAG: ABC transporter permease [Spirulinaceae cyanobacterium]
MTTATGGDRSPLLFGRLRATFTSATAFYIYKRLGQAILTLLLTSMLSFAIIQLAPGSYLDTLRENPTITEETINAYAAQFGLDQPPIVQYGKWLGNVLTKADFGNSFVYDRPVFSLIFERMGATLLLAVSSIIFTWAVALPLGILGAVRQNQWSDRVLQVVSYIAQGSPSFITALVLLVIAQYTTPLFPVGGMTSINYNQFSPLGKVLDIGWHMILPTLALTIGSFAGLQRLTRGSLLDVLRQEYIQTARAKGLPENRVIYVHALRNAVNPLVTILGFEFAALLSGSFITELFFNWPGLGRLIFRAVMTQDLYLVMAGLMMGAAMLIVGNLLADLLLKAVDPRIQLEKLQ